MLVDVDRLNRMPTTTLRHPDPGDPSQAGRLRDLRPPRLLAQRLVQRDHILATTEAICRYRKSQGIDGPLFIGKDSHALSEPATAHGHRSPGRQRRFGPGRQRRRPHADAGHLARDPDLQPRPEASGPRRRHRRHAVAQPARGRRLQVQPAQRRSGRHGRHRRDPARGQRPPRRAGLAASSARLRAGHRAGRHRYDFTGVYVADLANVVWTWRPSGPPASSWAWIRSAARASATGPPSATATAWT
jgi:hypothetical protein